MRKLSEINEGFWKQNINRAKENKIRLGDRLNTNVYDIEPVDFGLPFYVADRLLEIEDKSYMQYTSIMDGDEAEHIKKLGWRVPTLDELKELFKCVHVNYMYKGYESYFNLYKDGKESNVFIENLKGVRNRKIFKEIWTCDYDNSSGRFYTVFIEEPMIASDITTNKKEKHLNGSFLLIKDKSKVNESLWKSGINRAKSGEERLEDKINSNIKELNLNKVNIDTECPFYIASKDLEIDGKCSWLYDEIFPYEEYFEKHGWRIPTRQEILKYFYEDDKGGIISGNKFHVSVEYNNNECDVYLTSRTTGGIVKFLYEGEGRLFMNRRYYWLNNDEDGNEYVASLAILPGDAWGKYDAVRCTKCRKEGNVYRRIRLVKDK